MPAIPDDILSSIRAAAKEAYPSDSEMRAFYIESETEAYAKIMTLDFGPATHLKARIIASAEEYIDLWEERASFISNEIDAYKALQDVPADVPPEVIEEFKREAAEVNDWIVDQRDDIEGRIRQFRYIRDTRAKVEPLRELLTRMESIIGSECYNGNIQNYSAWGVWNGEGRSFRYPVTVLKNGEPEKRRSRFDDLKPEELITGYYHFGANELSIYRALIKIIDILKAEYGLRIPGE